MTSILSFSLLAVLLTFGQAPDTQPVTPVAPAVEEHAADGPAWTGYGDALLAAEKSGKKVIVDVYTDWCGWCKKMDKNVYGDKSVREYIEKHFIPVKLDAESTKSAHDVKGEKMTEKDIARAYGIRSFPTTVFLDSKGDAITAVPGYVAADKFVLVMKYIAENHYKTMKWEEFASQNG